MTMLDRMRRHKSWLKWSLALVVLSFVVFYIPSFLRTETDAAAPNDTGRYRIERKVFWMNACGAPGWSGSAAGRGMKR